jgi:hypothetical protein
MRIVLCATLVGLVPLAASAQEVPAQPEPPRLELFVGLRFPVTGAGFVPVPDGSRHQPDVGVDWNVNDRFSLVLTSPTFGVSWSRLAGTRVDYSFLAGGRVRFGDSRRLVPFASLLAGPTRGAYRPIGRGPATYEEILLRPLTPYSALRVAASGGLDLNVSQRYTIRLFEARHIVEANGPRAGEAEISVASGVVFRFGKR